ncbi:amidohydrolase family protein [Candidatus Woesearchaeota archaeon]|nr:amidohydrolase family protein [Candidatus Woesearchaeota archaeon]
MKKESVLLLSLIVVSLFIVSCARQTPNATEESSAENVPVVEEIKDVAETKEESITTEVPVNAKPAQKHTLIFPTLTYDEAYNGPLYGTSEQVGSASMDSYFKLLDSNGINFFIGMFGIFGEPTADTLISDQGLGEVIAAAQKHPYRIIPFFNPGIGGEEVEQYLGEELTRMYRNTLSASERIVGKGFIKGFGEVETQEWSVRHNDQKVLQLIDLAKSNNLHFMFHPVAGKTDDVQKIIETYPETIFLIHLFREDLANSKDKWIKILKEHDNLYFSMDAAHIIHVNNMDIIYDYDSTDQESSIKKFVSVYDSKEKSLVSEAIKAYKPLVDAVPDKIMWGTEIGPEYAFNPQVFDRAIKASRLVIAGFDKEHQEAVGYKNALRVFGQGVFVDASIKVFDTSSWQDCTDTQISGCDTSCEVPDTNTLTAEQEACFLNCLAEKQCKEVVEMDIG